VTRQEPGGGLTQVGILPEVFMNLMDIKLMTSGLDELLQQFGYTFGVQADMSRIRAAVAKDPEQRQMKRLRFKVC
jgi:hypothetical protein